MKSNKSVKRIYVAEYAGLYKIGVSSDPEKRISQLSCGCPGILLLFKSNYIPNCFLVEKELHEQFSKYCVGGEWFSRVDLGELQEIIGQKKQMVDYEEYVMKLKEEDAGKNQKHAEKYLSQFYSMESEDKKAENEEIEKFLLAVNGIDIPNIYSDLIYTTLFGKDTEMLVKEYKPGEYESFRKYITEEQSLKIKAVSKVIISLINMEWNYDKLKEFVKNQLIA